MKFILFLATALSLFALDFPMSLAVAPDGRVLVLSGGAKASISVVNGAELPLPDAWLGLTFAPDGKTVYAGGGSRGVVYEFSYAQGELKLTREMKAADFTGDVAMSPDGHLIYAADLFGNAIVVINPQSGRVIDRFKTGRRPYRILFHPDGRSYFVSSWADASVYQYNTVERRRNRARSPGLAHVRHGFELVSTGCRKKDKPRLRGNTACSSQRRIRMKFSWFRSATTKP